ncbi:hypothetical protein [Weissella viridescens]|uniref:hypothetical protein n=1 Tax=Weissella viridescens TaxID=1629 RepID=UPI003AF2D1A0
MSLATLNTILDNKIQGIDRLNQRLDSELMISVIPIPKLERLSSKYDERFYVDLINNLKVVRNFLNMSIVNMNQGVGFVDVETGKELSIFYMHIRLPLTMKSAELLVDKFCSGLDKKIQEFKHILDINLGSDDIAIPEPEPEPEPEPDHTPNVAPTRVMSTGYSHLYGLPNATQNGTQGAGFDENYYYIFGRSRSTDSKLLLHVVAKNSKDKSFMASGEIGNQISAGKQATPPDYNKNQLGHANDCAVISHNGNEVTLLVASMEPNKVATCIVNVVEQTVRFGTRITLKQLTNAINPNLIIASVQKLPDGKIMMTGGGRYWLADFNENEMKLESFARDTRYVYLDYIQNIFGTDKVKDLGFQSNWYENGYLYFAMNGIGNTNLNFVMEVIPQGPEALVIPSNRIWYLESDRQDFELEKVWFEKGQMMGNLAVTHPTDNYIAALNWKNA